MDLFTRDDPDGYSELGPDWIDTVSLLARIEFVTELAENRNAAYSWDVGTWLDPVSPRTPEQVVLWLNEKLFEGGLNRENLDLLTQSLATDENGEPTPLELSDARAVERRVRDLVGLMLSLPQWHYQ
ncbi:MAG TPA: DUF1800 family protein [Sedimentisphaerales bacterium]|nr:DUF1800 family protein [Sedimentisphaerales bacterium]